MARIAVETFCKRELGCGSRRYLLPGTRHVHGGGINAKENENARENA